MDMYKVDETVKLCDSMLSGTPRSGTPDPCLIYIRIGVRSFIRGSFTTFPWSQVRDGGLNVASCPGVFSSGIRPRRIQVVMVPFRECNSWDPALTVCLLFGKRRFEEFYGLGSAARRPLVHWCDVPEEFIGALVFDIVHPASDALDEFLYGFDTEVSCDYVI
ncbi:hypothetical protein EVAR_83769_1 [Eumeta japonica]|uniref:Uncharacterized protein n=1 Tax=Eumeta variegata TaxID=151549 RepID=A0A4C1WG46_EUMVA|nr:hypothetical protein EVAR_83769_1 [Eumeta japonica]